MLRAGENASTWVKERGDKKLRMSAPARKVFFVLESTCAALAFRRVADK